MSPRHVLRIEFFDAYGMRPPLNLHFGRIHDAEHFLSDLMDALGYADEVKKVTVIYAETEENSPAWP